VSERETAQLSTDRNASRVMLGTESFYIFAWGADIYIYIYRGVFFCQFAADAARDKGAVERAD